MFVISLLPWTLGIVIIKVVHEVFEQSPTTLMRFWPTLLTAKEGGWGWGQAAVIIAAAAAENYSKIIREANYIHMELKT